MRGRGAEGRGRDQREKRTKLCHVGVQIPYGECDNYAYLTHNNNIN